MNLKKLQDTNLKNKKVLMRVDFNVAMKDGKVQEDFRIAAARQSIEYIRSQSGACLALVSHLGRPAHNVSRSDAGRPEGKDESLSLGRLVDDVERILGIRPVFVPECTGEKVASALDAAEQGDVLLLENVRFESGETENDMEFARRLAQPFDVFVNDAFSVCHRDQASVTGVAELLPSCAGLHLQEEIEQLERVQNNPEHPAVAIIGGAKIETKLPLIRKFEKTYDTVLVGGKVANEAMDRMQSEECKTHEESGWTTSEHAEKCDPIQFSEKVTLPIDFADDRMDIGPKTVAMFSEHIKNAKTIVWNGPLGKFEDPEFARGTEAIAQAVADSNAFSLVGGGESVQAIRQMDFMNKISFVSTGGGAMLSYLGGEDMPGLNALVEV